MAQRSFTRGGGGVFTCHTCGHRTRLTTQSFGRDDMCGVCEELFGTQNALWDDGVETFRAEGGPAYRDKLIAGLAPDRVARMKKHMADLFAA